MNGMLKYELDQNTSFNAKLDLDGDKVIDFYEHKMNMNPRIVVNNEGNKITDDCGIIYFGKSWIDPKVDPDGDKISNFDEFNGGTNLDVDLLRGLLHLHKV